MRTLVHDDVRDEVQSAMRQHLRRRNRTIWGSVLVLPLLICLVLIASGTPAKLAAAGLVVCVMNLARMVWDGSFTFPDEEWYYKWVVGIFFGKSLTGKYSPRTIFAIFQQALAVEGWQSDPIERAILRACQSVREVYNNCAPVHGQEPFAWPDWATADLAQLSTNEMIRWTDARRAMQTEIALMRNAANN